MKLLNYKLGFISFIMAYGLSFFITPVFANSMTLEDLVREVKVALLRVQQNAEDNNLPPLSMVELEINTVLSKNSDGKLSLYVVEIEGSTTNEITNSVKLTLIPPSTKASSDVTSLQLADAISKSILAGSRAIAAAKKGSPPLHPKELKATIKFVIKQEGGGKFSISFPPFPIEIGAGGKIYRSYIQSISAIYELK